MEIVIKIEDYDREWIANGYYIPDEINEKIAKAIIDGTPLPKGHGELIDRDELAPNIHGVKSIIAVIDAPTSIEADKENDNG